MCTHPITITRNYPLVGTKTYTVPCGKCAECVNKKRSEIAALSVHQAMVSGDVRFFTLTYRDITCPVAIFDPALEKVVGFERGVSRWTKNGVFKNTPHFDKKRKLFYTPSLCREDVKLWLKQFRQAWKRSTGEFPKFKYCFFGEYGDTRGRPHIHGLVYGLSPEQVCYLSNLWNVRFGFTMVLPEVSRKASIDEVASISQYVSKYISKGIHQRFADILPFVEKPRRQSSLDFGQFSDEELRKYSDFLVAAILGWFPLPDFYPDGLPILSFVSSLIGANLCRLTDILTPFRNR